jgi:hypothetical protein
MPHSDPTSFDGDITPRQPNLQITVRFLRAFPLLTLLFGIPFTAAFWVLFEVNPPGAAPETPGWMWPLPIVGSIVWGVAMSLTMTGGARSTLSSGGLNVVARGTSLFIPRDAIRGIGIARVRASRNLTVWCDPKAVSAAPRKFQPLLKMGRKATGEEGVVPLLPIFLLSAARRAEIRRYVDSAGIRWIE